MAEQTNDEGPIFTDHRGLDGSSPATAPLYAIPAQLLASPETRQMSESYSKMVQYQHLTGNSLEQFTTGAQPVILWPAKYKTGDALYPQQNQGPGSALCSTVSAPITSYGVPTLP